MIIGRIIQKNEKPGVITISEASVVIVSMLSQFRAVGAGCRRYVYFDNKITLHILEYLFEKPQWD